MTQRKIFLGVWTLALGLAGCQTEGLVTNGSGGVNTAGVQGSGGRSDGQGGQTGGGGLSASGGASSVAGATVGGSPGAGGLTGGGGLTAAGGSADGGRSGGGGVPGAGGNPGLGGRTSGAGGSGGYACGGLADLACPASQFCEYPTGNCGKGPDAAGTCANTGSGICSFLLAPVCGCDGKTYSNDCLRRLAGVSKVKDGECAAPTQPCPADISQIDSWPCTEGLVCEYGTDPRPGCRASATCTGGKWTKMFARCTALPPVTCPATRADAAGMACPTMDAYCIYDGLACQCTNCSNRGPVSMCSGDPTWHCATPNTTPGCPAAIPLLGSQCSSAGLNCDYFCGAGGGRLCKGGAWTSTNGGPCPVSTRSAKKDILYLGAAERQRVADDLLRFKLATYEYRDPVLAGKRHLGFIIEDVPGSPAVDRDGNMVDLYGYTSMLLAAVQAQGQEIARLRAELSRMKSRRR